MKLTSIKKKDEARRMNRRNLLKWSVAAGAALSLPLWKVWEVLEGSHGYATAAAGASLKMNRSVHWFGGGGGQAWFQLLWPHVGIAQNFQNGNAWHRPGEGNLHPETDRPMWVTDQTPGMARPNNQQWTHMMAGNNETHTDSIQGLNNSIGSNVFGAVSSLQLGNPSLVPVITIGNNNYGNAQGAPAQAAVGSPDDMVGLFNSRASSAGGALENPADATLFHANYQALVQLNRAAGVSTKRAAYLTGLDAAEFVGINLGAQLTPTPADMDRYGLGGAPGRILNMGLQLITTFKAYQLGLCNSVHNIAMSDDPHGAFNNMATLNTTVDYIKNMMDAFMDDLAAADDPFLAGTKMIDNFVWTINGDTPKNPRVAQGWPDGTPGGSNWVHIYSGGWLKTGWHGGVDNNNVNGWDPQTGDNNQMSSNQLSQFAASSILHSVARGDENAIRTFVGDNQITGEGVRNLALM